MNGVPWWYFHKLEGAHEGTRLDSVDPGNVQWDGFGPDRVLGCVVYPAAEVIEPGVIKHIEGNRFLWVNQMGQSQTAHRHCQKSLPMRG